MTTFELFGIWIFVFMLGFYIYDSLNPIEGAFGVRGEKKW